MINLDICKISYHLLHKNSVSRTCPITLRTHLVVYFEVLGKFCDCGIPLTFAFTHFNAYLQLLQQVSMNSYLNNVTAYLSKSLEIENYSTCTPV